LEYLSLASNASLDATASLFIAKGIIRRQKRKRKRRVKKGQLLRSLFFSLQNLFGRQLAAGLLLSFSVVKHFSLSNQAGKHHG
jgi:hypothetical protein